MSKKSRMANFQNESYNSLRIEVLIDYLMRFITLDNQKVTNNICKRFSLSALHSFLPTLIQTKYASFSLDILVNLLHLRHSTYNLVKCELVDLIASIDFKTINYAEQNLISDLDLVMSKSTEDPTEEYDDDLSRSNHAKNVSSQREQRSNAELATFLVRDTQEKIIKDVYLYLLGSEDSRLRLETARSLARFVTNMSFYQVCSSANQNSLLSLGL